MDIYDLPSEILEKILIEGNFYYISKVCQKWYDIAKTNRIRFKAFKFDLTKDDPEKIEKISDVMHLYISQIFDENGFLNEPNIFDHFINPIFSIEFIFTKIFSKFTKIIENIVFLKTLYIILDPLFYIDEKIKANKKYNLINQKIKGYIISPFIFKFICFLKYKKKLKL